MWCPTCQALAGPDPDSRPSACPRCGNALVDPPEANTASEQARLLLEHWNSNNPLDSTPQTPETPPETKTPGKTAGNSKPHYRVDSAHAKHKKHKKHKKHNTSQDTQPQPNTNPPQRSQPEAKRSDPQPRADNNSPPPIDPLAAVAQSLANFSHDPHTQDTHTETSAKTTQLDEADATKPVETKPVETEPVAGTEPTETPPPIVAIPTGTTTNPLTHSTSLWGQLLAYIGVLGLTVGGALIIWNGFGHAPLNTPTAWLIGTAGQMLLLLGIVTLVSSGLEQTHEDVNRQVRLLSEQLLRIESGQAAESPAAPAPAPAPDAPHPHAAQPATTSTTKPK